MGNAVARNQEIIRDFVVLNEERTFTDFSQETEESSDEFGFHMAWITEYAKRWCESKIDADSVVPWVNIHTTYSDIILELRFGFRKNDILRKFNFLT